jgi:hypothetical protein
VAHRQIVAEAALYRATSLMGPIASLWLSATHFRSASNSGHRRRRGPRHPQNQNRRHRHLHADDCEAGAVGQLVGGANQQLHRTGIQRPRRVLTAPRADRLISGPPVAALLLFDNGESGAANPSIFRPRVRQFRAAPPSFLVRSKIILIPSRPRRT